MHSIFITDLNELHQHLWPAHAEAQCQYQVPANSDEFPAPEFKIGSWVYVKAQFSHILGLPRNSEI